MTGMDQSTLSTATASASSWAQATAGAGFSNTTTTATAIGNQLNVITQARARYLDAQSRLITLIRTGQIDAGREFLFKELRPLLASRVKGPPKLA